MRLLLTSILLLVPIAGAAATEITEILPENVEYDSTITTPEAHLGFQVGVRHIYHHELVSYLRKLAEQSDRVTIHEYAKSYAGRPLVLATITSPANHASLDAIRNAQLALADPDRSSNVDLDSLPAVINMGYSVHGNEPSGGNAVPLVAYYLAAAKGADHQRLLDDVVILIDPCLNPDGFDRFANWANNHRGATLNPDPNHREHRENWPSGRTNYYMFDLNRDWLPAQHPESQGRLAEYHKWKPNVVLDFHEMGTDSTYFFQPGVPLRNYPGTPRKTFQLTRQFAKYHSGALDRVGSLYYTEERFDDFYLGKGSTYPDMHGAVGILFEQASARGHLQESINGLVSLPFTIRNQFLTSMSSLKATHDLRTDLLESKRTFYKDAIALARANSAEGYVVKAPNDPVRLHRFMSVLNRHDIESFRLKKGISTGGEVFPAELAYFIPMLQPEYRFLEALFETRTYFAENIFYDVSTWTLPLAFNITYRPVEKVPSADQLGEPFTPDAGVERSLTTTDGDLAYVIDWRDYFAPSALFQLLDDEVIVKVATREFAIDDGNGAKTFPPGTLMVPMGIQPEARASVAETLKAASEQGTRVHVVSTGLTPTGIDLGSSYFRVISRPKVLLVGGSDTSAYEAGEVWHLLDQRFRIRVTLADARNLGRVQFDEYSVIILVSGSNSAISESAKDRIKEFVSDGGTVLAIGTSISWVNKNLTSVDFRGDDDQETESGSEDKPVRRPYGEATRDAAFRLVRGSIFKTDVDTTHPIGYGFEPNTPLPVFRNNTVFLEPARNVYSTPVLYDANPLISGYVSDENLKTLSSSASTVVKSLGRGRVILMADNPNFRAFWYGTNRLFLNGVFFGPLVRVP